MNQLKTLFACTLFDWSWIWSFTHCSSILEFQVSLRFLFREFRAFLTLCVHSGEHKVYLIINKTTLLFKIIKKDIFYDEESQETLGAIEQMHGTLDMRHGGSFLLLLFLFKKLNCLHFYFI